MQVNNFIYFLVDLLNRLVDFCSDLSVHLSTWLLEVVGVSYFVDSDNNTAIWGNYGL